MQGKGLGFKAVEGGGSPIAHFLCWVTGCNGKKNGSVRIAVLKLHEKKRAREPSVPFLPAISTLQFALCSDEL